MRHPPTPAALFCAAVLLLLTGCSDGGEKKDTKPPTTPTGVHAEAGSATSVHLMWHAAKDDKAVTGYELYQKGKRVKTVPGDRTMADVEGLAPATAYTFTVRARDAAGNVSPAGPAAAVTTPAPTPNDKKPPTTPGKLRGTVDGQRSVTLSWSGSTDNFKVTAYDIYQEDTRIHSVSGTETTTQVPGLRPGIVYTFTVRARDASENSSPDSNSVDLTTEPAPGKGPSTAPTDLTTEVEKGRIELSWLPPDIGGAVKSHELYLNGRLGTTIVWGAEPPDGRATYTMVVTDPPGTRYSVKIRAKLPDGKWGDFSAQRTVVVR
ncbi:fibronectin type III domain-containing protein [Streptomyces sp. NPDC059248]